MGLEEFESDSNKSETDKDNIEDDSRDGENSVDGESSVDEKQDEKENKNQNEESEEKSDGVELSGLESFKSTETDSEDSEWTEELERERANPWIEDFTAGQWNDMSTKEKVKYVRENYQEDYRPEVRLEHEWDYRKVIEIECVCRNTFTFRSGGTCMDCGRGYKYTGSTVVKKYDPHGDDNNEFN